MRLKTRLCNILYLNCIGVVSTFYFIAFLSLLSLMWLFQFIYVVFISWFVLFEKHQHGVLIIPKLSLILIYIMISAYVNIKVNCDNIDDFYWVNEDEDKDFDNRRTNSNMMINSQKRGDTKVSLLSTWCLCMVIYSKGSLDMQLQVNFLGLTVNIVKKLMIPIACWYEHWIVLMISLQWC